MAEFIVLQDRDSASPWLPKLVALFVEAARIGKHRFTTEEAEAYWIGPFRDLGECKKIWLSVEASCVLAAAQVLSLKDISPQAVQVVDLFVPDSAFHKGYGSSLFRAIEESVGCEVGHNHQTSFIIATMS